MKRKLTAILLTAVLCLSALAGCGIAQSTADNVKSDLSDAFSEIGSDLNSAKSEIESDLNSAKSEIESGLDDAKSSIASGINGAKDKITGESSSSKSSSSSKTAGKTYTMADVDKLTGTSNFAKNTLNHIFNGNINSKGKATGYHYNNRSDSKGSIIEGTQSKTDKHGVFKAQVKVDGVKKNGFSSFFPSDWSPQEVVDAINTAYDYALADSDNPEGELWIGYCNDLEIDMYLNDSKKITTAFPVYEED